MKETFLKIILIIGLIWVIALVCMMTNPYNEFVTVKEHQNTVSILDGYDRETIINNEYIQTEDETIPKNSVVNVQYHNERLLIDYENGSMSCRRRLILSYRSTCKPSTNTLEFVGVSKKEYELIMKYIGG